MSRISVTVVLYSFAWLSTLCPLFAQESPSSLVVAKQLRNAGIAFHDQQEYLKAVSAFSESLELFPHAEVYVERSWVWMDRGKVEEAIADCNRAIELDPKLSPAYFWRADCYTKMKDYSRALDDCTTAIEFRPKEALSYMSRAKVHYMLEQWDRAVEDIDLAIKIDSTRPIFVFRRAECNAMMKQWEAMLADAERMITLDPNSSDAYVLRGEANLALEKIGKSCRDFAKANVLGNLSATGRNQLASFCYSYTFEGDHDTKQMMSLYLNLHRIQDKAIEPGATAGLPSSATGE